MQVKNFAVSYASDYPSQFYLKIPILFNQEKTYLNLAIKRGEGYNSAIVEQKQNDALFPCSFYKTLIKDLELEPLQLSIFNNYDSTYYYFKRRNFIVTDWVGYKKNSGKGRPVKLITVVDYQ